jgi:undecaprenyl-diphosphatase
VTSPLKKALLTALFLFYASIADACPNLIDCSPSQPRVTGIWALFTTPYFPLAMTTLTAGSAMWDGAQTRFGRTLWQSLDSAVIAGVSTTVLKYSFQRARPSQNLGPNDWFSGSKSQSFPSGDVSNTAALVSPFMYEYGSDHPMVYLLGLIPVIDMAARIEARGHYPTDTIAGLGLGFASGWAARHYFKSPFTLQIIPGRDWSVGLSRRF